MNHPPVRKRRSNLSTICACALFALLPLAAHAARMNPDFADKRPPPPPPAQPKDAKGTQKPKGSIINWAEQGLPGSLLGNDKNAAKKTRPAPNPDPPACPNGGARRSDGTCPPSSPSY